MHFLCKIVLGFIHWIINILWFIKLSHNIVWGVTLTGNTGIRIYIFNSKIGWFKWTFNSFTSAGPHCIWNRNPRTLKTVLIKSLQWFVPFVAQIIKAWLLIKIPGSVSSSVTWHKGLVHRWNMESAEEKQVREND